MSEKFGIKVEEIFNSMEERFRSDGAEGIDDSFGYDIKGVGKWKLTVKDGKMNLEQTDDLSGCVVVLKADADTFVGAQIGKVDWGEAFSSGQLSVDGDMGALGKTGKLFKKFVPPKKELTTGEYIKDMFGTLCQRFNAKAAEGMDVKISYDISGPDGGQWTAYIKDGEIKIEESIPIMPTAKLKASAEDYVDIQLDRADGMALLSAGRVGFEGDATLIGKLGDLFQKYQPPGSDADDEQELLVLKKVISVNQRFATGPVMGKFLKGLAQKKIYANRCPKCKRLQIPPREICAVCRVKAEEDFIEVGPTGNIRYMDTAYFASPDPLTGETRETPYGTAHILLEGCEGNDTLTHFVRRDQLDRIEMGWNDKKGTVVRPVWTDNPRQHILDIEYFEIDE